MTNNVKLILQSKNTILEFFNEKNNKTIKLKVPIFWIFFDQKQVDICNFTFIFNMEVYLFENFLFWLFNQNLINQNQIFFQKKLYRNKIFCIKLKNSKKILFWKNNVKNVIIFAEQKENFANNFFLSLQNFLFEIKKYSKLFLTTTDTVAGIGSFYSNLDFEGIFEIKNRPREKKIVTLIGYLNQIKPFITLINYQNLKKVSKKFWPGAITLIIEKKSFRIPNLFQLQVTLKKFGPAFVTSANFSGEMPLNLYKARIKFWQIIKIFDFKSGSNKVSKIFDIDKNEWIR